jgi:hypothetical protein
LLTDNLSKGDAALTIEELIESTKTGQAEQIMKRMSAYSANITGSNAYW